jgi:hypothetical protein
MLGDASVGTLHPLQEELDRLIGQRVQASRDGYHVLDVAGEGQPQVGCVRSHQGALYLVSDTARSQLAGPLAIPRIAGPNYKVWIIGDVDDQGRLWVRRIGILASPEHARCPPLSVSDGESESHFRISS